MDGSLALIEASILEEILRKAGTRITKMPKVSLIKIGKFETFIKFVRITIVVHKTFTKIV